MKITVTTFAVTIMLMAACTNAGDKKAVPDGKLFNAKWTYRSLLNNTNVNTDFDSLAFAAATINLSAFGNDSLKGQILWAMDSAGTIFNGLNLTGRYFYSDTTICYFIKGFGDTALGTAGWQYNYQGSLLPHWPDGINQAVVLAGTVVRVKKHSCNSAGNHCSPAGVVATTYMVKQ